MSVGEYEHEPVRGLPEYLPPGENLVWKGEPDFRVMARRVFHVRTVSMYFALLIVVHLGVQLAQGGSIASVALGSAWMVALGMTAIGILSLLALAYSRTTVYTLTDKRLVIRTGVAMPMMVNIPLTIIESADMRSFTDGSGDIVLTLNQKKRLSYLFLWPNVRSWRLNPVHPALRSISDVDTAAAKLASVVSSAARPRPGQSPAMNDDSADNHAMLGAS